jgi:hypothetical protein
MDSFIVKNINESMEEEISKLVAVDRISFSKIVKSKFIRKNLQNYKSTRLRKNVPRSENTIKAIFMQTYKTKKNELIAMIKTKLENGSRFSITMDEWTGCNNKRYLNVNLHDTFVT